MALFVNWIVARRSRKAFRDIRAKTARMNAFLNEQVSGMAVVQAYAREKAAAAEFDDINVAYRDANNRSIMYEAIARRGDRDGEHRLHRLILVAVGLAAPRAVGTRGRVRRLHRQFFEPICQLVAALHAAAERA